jgi:CRP-like cAMP-binding protein
MTAFAPMVFDRSKALADLMEKRCVPAQFQLFSQDYPTEIVYLVETGLVKLVRLSNSGQESILGLRSDGCLVNAASTILNAPANCSAITVTACTVRYAHRARFMKALESSPSLMMDLSAMICQEICSELEVHAELSAGSAQRRLDRLRRELSGRNYSNDPLGQLALKRFEIAQLLSITPEHLSRLLGR